MHRGENVWWFGSLGDTHGLDEKALRAAREQLRADRTTAITLETADAEAFYVRLCNGILWPLYHDRLDHLPLHLNRWDVYERVNTCFADTIAEALRPGDVVWVHDYHLMRLPALLRQRVPAAKIGFFLHVPFPNPEMFLVLPARRSLVEGMLGADVVGFHTRRYRGHFTAVMRRLEGLEMDADSHVRFEGRAVRLGVFPIGVDAEDLSRRSAARPVILKALEYRPGRERLILGIDRLDYTKGIPRRLAAIDQLLIDHPEWRRNVRFLQVAVPSRDTVAAYRRYRQEVERLVARINGRFGTPSWMPIHYLHQSLEEDEVLALYRAADVMLVTPVRDGMNLVAKEFVASRSDESGVLVLSEFAGAADDLNEALIVNPYDTRAVAAAIHQALHMEGAERRCRMRQLRARVFARDVHWWARTFLQSLTDGSVASSATVTEEECAKSEKVAR
jgi:trehalose 6-phosphate synthase/phosphatase